MARHTRLSEWESGGDYNSNFLSRQVRGRQSVGRILQSNLSLGKMKRISGWTPLKMSNSIYTPSIFLYTPLERWGENMGVCDMGCIEKKMGCK